MEICDLLKIGPNQLLAKSYAEKKKTTKKTHQNKQQNPNTVAHKTNSLIL